MQLGLGRESMVGSKEGGSKRVVRMEIEGLNMHLHGEPSTLELP